MTTENMNYDNWKLEAPTEYYSVDDYFECKKRIYNFQHEIEDIRNEIKKGIFDECEVKMLLEEVEVLQNDLTEDLIFLKEMENDKKLMQKIF